MIQPKLLSNKSGKHMEKTLQKLINTIKNRLMGKDDKPRKILINLMNY